MKLACIEIDMSVTFAFKYLEEKMSTTKNCSLDGEKQYWLEFLLRGGVVESVVKGQRVV